MSCNRTVTNYGTMIKISRENFFGCLKFTHLFLVVSVAFCGPTTCESAGPKCPPGNDVKCWTCDAAKSISGCACNGEWKDCRNNETCSFTLKRNYPTATEDEIYMGCFDDTQISEEHEQVLLTNSSILECSSCTVGSICYNSSVGVGLFLSLYHEMMILANAYGSLLKCKGLMDEYLIDDDNSTNFNNSTSLDNSTRIDNSTNLVDTEEPKRGVYFELLGPFKEPLRRVKRNLDGNEENKKTNENDLYEMVYLKKKPHLEEKNNENDRGTKPAIPESHKCSEVMCLMFCDFGFEKDKYGCSICKCLNPCEHVSCKATEHCEVRTLEVPTTHTATPQGICIPNGCSANLCKMACRYGFMKDEFGCEFCQCFEPCERVNCSDKQLCEVQSSIPCDAHPYTTKGVCVPNKACSPVRCRMFCQYGFQKNELGCEFCKCFQPCETIKCTKDTHCAVKEVPSSEHEVYPYKYRGFCAPNDECPLMMCEMFCPYGFTRDEFGCEVCKCYEPCATIECTKDTRCTVKDCKASEDYPHRYKGVCLPIHVCSPVTCRMACQYGFMRDEFGCEICECFEPCATIRCANDTHCAPEEVPSSEAYPYKYLGICFPDHECSPVTCRIACQYGYVLDEFGCEICECLDPCATVRCAENTHCAVEEILSPDSEHSPFKYRGVCAPNHECSQVMCRMFCQYGFTRDEFGCEVCDCFEPCENVTCDVNRHCEIQSVNSTASHPYTGQGVCVPDLACLPVLCEMLCRYGFERDDLGCEQCSCYEPCQLIDCRDGLICEVQPVDANDIHPFKYKPVCVPIKQCLPVLCERSCLYELEKDEFGCDQCKCYEPCQLIHCAPGHTCEVQPFNPTKDHPYHYQAVCIPQKQCLPVLCKMLCQYGFEKDESGCEQCSCYEPCQLMECAPGYTCQVHPFNATRDVPYNYHAVCVPQKQCLPVLCERSCPFELEKDEFGCDQCKCYEPCQLILCARGHTCEVQPFNATKDHPYHYQAVCIPKKQCVPVLCERSCLYELEKDEFGCDQCKCYEPCQLIDCAPGHTCEVQPFNPTKDHPYHYQAVCIQQKQCLPVLCKMLCQYGFEKDESGCEQCSCYEPCQLVECAPGYTCQVQPFNATRDVPYNYHAVCVPQKCQPVLCRMFCRYGFEKDESGCEKCLCYEPCQLMDCAPGYTCDVQPFKSTREHPYNYQAACVSSATDHCTCTIYGDPMMITFNGTHRALLEPKQYTMTSYQGGLQDDKIAIYVIIEQTSDFRFPGNLDVQKLTITYENEFIVMDADKVAVNSRFATPLPYTDPANRFNITSEQGKPERGYGGTRKSNPNAVVQKLNTFRLQTASGICLVVSPRRQEDKVLLSVPRGIQTKVSSEGLCGLCS